MHQDFNLTIEKLSKIEGHAFLEIKVRKGKVKKVDLRVMENKRFFVEAAEGKNAFLVPDLVSRICGTCSIAHLTCCIEAIEKALKISPSFQTILMRKLMMYSLMIRDHALHLYFFVLPDVFGKDSLLDFVKEKKEIVHKALHLKEAGNELSRLVGGRAIHALFEKVGNFEKIPEKSKIPKVVENLKRVRESVLELIEIFYSLNWKLERKTNFVALKTKDFSFLEGKIYSSSGEIIEEKDYWKHLHELVIPYSQAGGFEFEGKEYMVGALARMNLNKENLHPQTKKDLKKYLEIFPSNNIYHNNLAQAIEILHSIDHSLEILQNYEFKKEKKILPQKESGKGAGVIEAPRGTLYYGVEIEKGKIKYLNLVIPTAQNLINMRKDIQEMVKKEIEGKEKKQKIQIKIRKEAEKIIRAYDPCMSCASHFLKIKWL